MAFDPSGVEATAAALSQQVRDQYGEEVEVRARTVGVLAAVTVTDPQTGQSSTVTHFKFTEEESGADSPNFVALGLVSQIAAHLSQVRVTDAT